MSAIPRLSTTRVADGLTIGAGAEPVKCLLQHPRRERWQLGCEASQVDGFGVAMQPSSLALITVTNRGPGQELDRLADIGVNYHKLFSINGWV